MKITDACKERFLELFKENDVDTLIISTKEQSENGFVMDLDLGKKTDKDRIIDVNGINVSISEADEELFEDITFDVDGDKIAIIKDHCCCGGHCHDDDDDCCCCGEEEHECHCHDDGCSCGCHEDH